MNINQTLTRWQLGIQAGTEIHAGVREHFRKHKDGSSTCKLCGEKVAHPRAAMAHMGVHHKEELEHAADVTVSAGGPGSGRKPYGAGYKPEPLEDSANHRNLMTKLFYRGQKMEDKEEGSSRKGISTKNDKEHGLAKDLSKHGYLKSFGNNKWGINLKGHVAFDQDQL